MADLRGSKAKLGARTLDCVAGNFFQIETIYGPAIQSPSLPIQSSRKTIPFAGLPLPCQTAFAGQGSHVGQGSYGAGRKGAGQGMAQPRRERLDRQRERQRAYRAEMKAKRTPSRDDIARTLLHFAITKNLERGAEDELFSLQQMIVGEFVTQSFEASDAVFDDLIEKYRGGWTFQRKLHLRPQDDEQGRDG